jgi:hypothetical protein
VRFGSVRTRVILVQVAILAGVVAWYRIFLPEIQKEHAAAEATRREQKIEALVQSMVIAAAGRESDGLAAPGQMPARPQRLRITPPVDEVERALGAPDTSMTDFRGGQHLTWVGTRHSLELSLDKGRLYALTLTDLQSGHGTQVFESALQWRAF